MLKIKQENHLYLYSGREVLLSGCSGYWCGFLPSLRGLLKYFQGQCYVRNGSTGTQGRRNQGRFGNFLLGSACLFCFFGVHLNAVRALGGKAYGQGNQLPVFSGNVSVFPADYLIKLGESPSFGPGQG